MTTSRRTALAMLGLGSASAIGSESFSKPPEYPGEVHSVTGSYDRERYAQTFERLAAELRRDAVEIESIKLTASLDSHEVADRHELSVRFIYKPEV